MVCSSGHSSAPNSTVRRVYFFVSVWDLHNIMTDTHPKGILKKARIKFSKISMKFEQKKIDLKFWLLFSLFSKSSLRLDIYWNSENWFHTKTTVSLSRGEIFENEQKFWTFQHVSFHLSATWFFSVKFGKWRFLPTKTVQRLQSNRNAYPKWTPEHGINTQFAWTSLRKMTKEQAMREGTVRLR